MQPKNKKQIFNKYYMILFLLLGVLILVNLTWIKNDERPITYEDEVLLGYSANLYFRDLHGLELFKTILYLDYPPFIPSLMYLSFRIFGPFDDSAFYVNLFFWPILVLSCFFLGKKLYNEKTGLLAAFILSTLPPIIIFSRTTYAQFILVSLIMLNLTLFVYSDYFKNRFFSLLYGFSFALCLLTRYTSLPYIIVPPLFFIFFKLNIVKKLFSVKKLFKTKFKIKKQNIIIVAVKVIISLLIAYLIILANKPHLSNAFFIIIILLYLLLFLIIFTKKFAMNNFLDSMIVAFLLAIVWYASKLIFLTSTYSLEFSRHTSENILSAIGNIFFYLIFLINSQLCFLNFLIFVFVVIFLFVRYYKQRKIDEQDLLFFFIFLIPYIFYTLIPLKNWLVTTSLLIPISFIMAKGILKSPKIIKYVFLIVVIVGGLFYILPIQSFNRTITIDLGAQSWVEEPGPIIIRTNKINLFSKNKDDPWYFSKNSRFYALKDQQQIKEISKVIYSTLIAKNSTEVKTFFLYNSYYIYPHVLEYYLRLMNISSSSYSYHFSTFYETFHVPTNLSYKPYQEKDFEWIYNFDFLIVPSLNKEVKPFFSLYSENYYVICLYLRDSNKFKKNFKIIYQTSNSDGKIVQLYEHKGIN